MTIHAVTPAPARFGSHFQARFENTTRPEGNLWVFGHISVEHAGKEVAKKLDATKSVLQGKEGTWVQAGQDFYGFSNGKGFDVIVNDAHDELVEKHLLKRNKTIVEMLEKTQSPVTFELKKVPDSSFKTAEELKTAKKTLQKQYNVASLFKRAVFKLFGV
jgi:hypothetical protein